MGRYKKFYSTYLLASKHQKTSQGTVWERDWTTLGERHKLDPGKRPFYGDSNFIFTDNSIASYPTKSKSGKWIAHLTYDDIDVPAEKINMVRLNTFSDVLYDYAYYGSATELIRASVENIINEFPGNITVGSSPYMEYDSFSGQFIDSGYYTISNPFGIDLITTSPSFENYENELRYLAYNYAQYRIGVKDEGSDNDICSDIMCYNDITGYAIQANSQDYGFIETTVLNGELYGRIGNRIYRYNKTTGEFVLIQSYNDTSYVCCGFGNCDGSEQYVCDTSGEDPGTPAPKTICVEENSVLYTITISTEGLCGQNEYVIKGLYTSRGIVWVSETSDFVIQPKQDVIDEYFESLSGFEATLLNTNTKPLYKNTFMTPYENDRGFIRMRKDNYTWPSIGYCIDIVSTSYTSFLKSLIALGEAYDKLWSDNIYRNMTHESIKNFDYAFSRHLDSGEEMENILGGEKMARILRLYGRFFDDLRLYINGIGNADNISYDRINNTTTAEISDKCELHGIDMYSTIWQPYEYVVIEDGENVPDTAVKMLALPTPVDSESPDYVCLTCYNGCNESSDESSDYMCYKKVTSDPNSVSITCRFVNSTDDEGRPYIEKHCGWITENFTGFYYRQTSTPEHGAIYEEFDTAPEYCTASTPEYIKVINNGKRYYFTKTAMDESVCNGYLHDTWYGGMSYSKINPINTDIEFARRLYLSAPEILKTKGTVHSIEMVMAMFGLVKDDGDGSGDYSVTEYYRYTTPKDSDSPFYFYRVAIEGVDYTNPDESFIILTYIPEATATSTDKFRIGNEEDGYVYYLKESRSTLLDAVAEANNGKSLERYYTNAFSGVPIDELVLNNGNSYLIPYYNQKRWYDGDFVFQSKGGWGKKGVDGGEYMETMAYLKVESSIDKMLETNPMTSAYGDICYVADITDYTNYYQESASPVSHYFKLINETSPYEAASWENIPVEGSIVYPNFTPAEGSYVTHGDYLRVKYLSGIINVNESNNPHVGYGEYDCGDEYFDYMGKPFRYAINNFGFRTEMSKAIADNITYDISNPVGDNDKIKIIEDKFEYRVVEDQDEISGIVFDGFNTFSEEFFGNMTYSASSPLYVKVEGNSETTYYRRYTVPSDEAKSKYYLNSKVLVITNLIDSRYYNGYFNDVILKYLMQVIPSTTILVLEGFENEMEKVDTVDITLNVCDGFEDAELIGAGTYIRCSNVYIEAVAPEGCRFVRWIGEGETITEPLHMLKNVISSKTYTACFERSCQIAFSIPEHAYVEIISISGNVSELSQGDILRGDSVLTLYGDGSFAVKLLIDNGYTAQYEFKEWRVDGELVAGNSDVFIVKLADREHCGKTITADLKLKQYKLRLFINSECGDNEVEFSNAGNIQHFYGVNMDNPAEKSYDYGSAVRIEIPDINQCCEFVNAKHNEDYVISTENPFSVSITGNIDCTATIQKAYFDFDVSIDSDSENGEYQYNGESYTNSFRIFSNSIRCGDNIVLTATHRDCYEYLWTVSSDNPSESYAVEGEILEINNIENRAYHINLLMKCGCKDIMFNVDRLYIADSNPSTASSYVDISEEYSSINEYEMSVGLENRMDYIILNGVYYDLVSAGKILIDNVDYTNKPYNIDCEETNCGCGKISDLSAIPSDCSFKYVGMADNATGLWVESNNDCCEDVYVYEYLGQANKDCPGCEECRYAHSEAYNGHPEYLMQSIPENPTSSSPLYSIIEQDSNHYICYKLQHYPSCDIRYLPISYNEYTADIIFDKYGIDITTLEAISQEKFDEKTFESCVTIDNDNRFVRVNNEGEDYYYQIVVNCEKCDMCIECNHEYTAIFVHNMEYERTADDYAHIGQYVIALDREGELCQSLDDYLIHNPYNADSPEKLVVETNGFSETGEGYEYYILTKPGCCERNIYITQKPGSNSIRFFINNIEQNFPVVGSGYVFVDEFNTAPYSVYAVNDCEHAIQILYNNVGAYGCQCDTLDHFINGYTTIAGTCNTSSGCIGFGNPDSPVPYELPAGTSDVFLRVNID